MGIFLISLEYNTPTSKPWVPTHGFRTFLRLPVSRDVYFVNGLSDRQFISDLIGLFCKWT